MFITSIDIFGINITSIFRVKLENMCEQESAKVTELAEHNFYENISSRLTKILA